MIDEMEKEKKTPVVLDKETKQKVADAVETESVSVGGPGLVETAEDEPETERHDMKKAIRDVETCGSCFFHGPKDAPLMFIVGVEVKPPGPAKRSRGLVLPNRMAKPRPEPQPMQQPMIMGCVCENPESDNFQRLVTINCSCSLFGAIPKAEMPEKKILEQGGKIEKKMESAPAG